MGTQWTVVISPEVAAWYRTLVSADQQLVDKVINLLATRGNLLRMPHSRALGSGLFELRFAIQHGTIEQRITYTFDPERMVITLTVFRKTTQNERAEVVRARQAKHDHDKETLS
ncbi:MAG: type II toxin-antitoxin system RelE/ParE family toxin [Propionibacteriaceae bacterium]|jgi:hypothetical protein|nr:type II toxin-antitoxin system RelE/ParE family toxin [Propionibacteriaceae bacterium]